MMAIKTHFHYLFTFLLVVSLYSCSKTKKTVVFDNPSNQHLKISSPNFEDFELAAESKKEVEVTFGKFEMKVNDKVHKVRLNPDKEYLINPSMERYYIQSLLYLFHPRGLEQYEREYGDLKSLVEGKEVKGEYERLDSMLVIPKTWTFGLDEIPTQTGQNFQKHTYDYFRVRKIHRASDLSRSMIFNFLLE